MILLPHPFETYSSRDLIDSFLNPIPFILRDIDDFALLSLSILGSELEWTAEQRAKHGRLATFLRRQPDLYLSLVSIPLLGQQWLEPLQNLFAPLTL